MNQFVDVNKQSVEYYDSYHEDDPPYWNLLWYKYIVNLHKNK